MTAAGARIHRPRLLRQSAVVLLGFAVARAQPPALPTAALPAYDVVSIKPNPRGPGSTDTTTRNDTYSAENVSIEDLMAQAYDIRQELISGISGAMASARFDVQAKVVEPDMATLRTLTPAQRRAMLVPILTERFHLKCHTEMKTLSVYELVVVRGGPKFQPSPTSGKESGTSIHGTGTGSQMEAKGVSMASLAKTLAGQARRPVIDKTGLAGMYDLKLKWRREDGPTTDEETLPGLFTALEEQLGLKLQPGKGPVETLVVDHVDMPSGN